MGGGRATTRMCQRTPSLPETTTAWASMGLDDAVCIVRRATAAHRLSRGERRLNGLLSLPVILFTKGEKKKVHTECNLHAHSRPIRRLDVQ